MKLTLTLLLFFASALAVAQQPLRIPDTLSGPEYELVLREGATEFFPGIRTRTMGVNGDVLGPTLLLNKYDDVSLRVINQLSDTTTLHWHGLHVAARNDGGPHSTIAPGATWNPRFTVLDWASTYWYHPHPHHRTNEHVSLGISGLIIVRDSAEARLQLPRRYGVDDFPLVVQSRDFDGSGQIAMHTAHDSTLMVNATIKPYLDVPAQIVRFRLLNGSSERTYLFGLSDNRPFHQIASDGGLLSTPVRMTRLMLSPGERAEILVDFSNQRGQNVLLMNFGSEIPSGIYGAAQPGMGPGQTIPGYTANPLNGRNRSVLEFRIGDANAEAITSLPTSLVPHAPWPASSADTTRTFTFMSSIMGPRAIEGPFMINDVHFDPDIINEYIPFENVEVWELRNMTPIAHPFHIHDVQFCILSINGVSPPPGLAGRKDVVLVPPGNGVVRFITKFETHHDNTFPYMYHCHLLTHEDHGMMGQFIVSSPPVSTFREIPTVRDRAVLREIHPNPASDVVTLRYELPSAGHARLQVFDAMGRLVATLVNSEQQSGVHQTRFTAAGLPPGMYTCVLRTTDGSAAMRTFILLR
ncbi:MAG: multicopper oxidase domain-containing protein [Bacteroidia bacterium]|nr:multicopper oxidase domain-containing protein [Bacteroidia bacterium]